MHHSIDLIPSPMVSNHQRKHHPQFRRYRRGRKRKRAVAKANKWFDEYSKGQKPTKSLTKMGGCTMYLSVFRRRSVCFPLSNSQVNLKSFSAGELSQQQGISTTRGTWKRYKKRKKVKSASARACRIVHDCTSWQGLGEKKEWI